MKVKNLTQIALTLFGIQLLWACGGEHMPLPPITKITNANNARSGAQRAEVTYEDVKPIFKTACGICHNPTSPMANWQDYAVASRLKDRLHNRVVVLKNMPPPGMPLSDSDRALIGKWISGGAVEKNEAPAEASTTEAPAEVNPSVVPADQAPAPVATQPAVEPAPARCEDTAPKYEGAIPTLTGEFKDQIKQGHATYIKYGCANCHGTTGHGDGPVAVAYNPKPRNFHTEDYKKGARAEEIFGTITVGLCGMPPYGSIPEQERMELATFLAAVRQNDGDALQLFTQPPAPVAPTKVQPKSKKPRQTPVKKKP